MKATVLERRSLLRELTLRGIRITGQRKILIETIQEADHHLDAASLLDLARRRDDGINRATVYRTIELLKKAKFPGEQIRPIPAVDAARQRTCDIGEVADMVLQGGNRNRLRFWGLPAGHRLSLWRFFSGTAYRSPFSACRLIGGNMSVSGQRRDARVIVTIG